MGEISQVASITPGVTPPLYSGLGVIALLTTFLDGTTPVAVPHPNRTAVYVAQNINAGGTIVLVGADATKRPWLYHLLIRCSAAVQLFIGQGGVAVCQWTFTANQVLDLNWGMPGYMCPAINTDLVVFNGGAVATTVDINCWYALQ